LGLKVVPEYPSGSYRFRVLLIRSGARIGARDAGSMAHLLTFKPRTLEEIT